MNEIPHDIQYLLDNLDQQEEFYKNSDRQDKEKKLEHVVEMRRQIINTLNNIKL